MTSSKTITVELRPNSTSVRAGLFAGCAAVAILATPGAIAQEAGPQAQEASNVDRVVVTGSRLRGVEDPVGSPVLAIGRDDIELASVTTVDKIIQQTPQIFDLGVSEGSRAQNGGSGNIVYGTGINLRGLGPYATLVLVDGHRAISNGRSVDPSFLPSLGLERVEVLADGASAVYGSDAVAGVVNLIPRRFVDGGQFFARYGSGDEYDEKQIGISWGETWDSGQIHLAYEHNFRSNLSGDDRAFFTSDQRDFGGNDYRLSLCNPGNIIVGGVSYAIPEGGVTPATSSSLTAGTANRCEALAGQDLLPEQSYNSYAMTFNQDITPWLEFVADAMYMERKFYRNSAPFNATLTVPGSNFYFTRPDGTTGATTLQYNFGDDVAGDSTSGFAENLQVTAGLVATLPNDWRGEFLASYGENRDYSESRKGVNNGALTAALASSNPATAFDPYGLNRTPQSVIDGIFNQIFLAPTNNDFTGYEARFDGPLFSLPGGEVRLAVGYERQEHATSLGNARGNPGTPIVFRDFDREVDSAYAELFVPLFGDDNAVPGIRRLELNVAGRIDDYSDVGKTENPKVGVNWSPIDDLTIRGSWGTSLRAPIFAELYGNSSNLFVQGYSDPTAGGAVIQGVALSGGNLGLEPEEAETTTIGFEWEPSSLPGASFGLTYFDIEYEGQIAAYLSNLTLLSDEAQFAGTGIILRGTAAADRVTELLGQGITVARGVIPATVTLFVDGRTQNLGRSLMEGFDFKAAYNMDFMGGDLDLSLDGTYLTKFDYSITPNGQVLDRLDVIFNPLDFKARTMAVWSNDVWRVNGSINYIDGYTNDQITPRQKVDAFTTVDLGVAITPGGDRLKPFLDGGFTLGLDIRNLFDEEPPYVNISPNVNGSGGYDATAANPVGRVIGVSLRKHF